MKSMVKDFIIPWIKEEFDIPVIYHRIIRTVGIGESWLADIIKDWEDQLPGHIKLAYLPSFGQVRLRLTALGQDLDQLKKDTQVQVDRVLPKIRKYFYGYDQEDLPEALGKMLRARKLTIATAESCTGGAVASLLTSVPGSSDYYVGSVIAYDNRIKTELLHVDESVLAKHGAVSEETVRAMAEKVRLLLKADIGISTSGVAGPGGGTEDKPVGTIWLGYADAHGSIGKKVILTKQRDVNIKFSSMAVLNMARIGILKNMDKPA
jgi:nicotinamide-nucleotide amidase